MDKVDGRARWRRIPVQRSGQVGHWPQIIRRVPPALQNDRDNPVAVSEACLANFHTLSKIINKQWHHLSDWKKKTHTRTSFQLFFFWICRKFLYTIFASWFTVSVQPLLELQVIQTRMVWRYFKIFMQFALNRYVPAL